MTSRVKLVLLIGALSVCGFGCAKPASPQTSATGTAAIPTSTAKFPTFPHVDTPKTTKQELVEILQNFNNTKSFNAKVTTTSPNQSIFGLIQYAKPNRFAGIIQDASSSTEQTEIVIVDNDLYMRTNKTAWSEFTQAKGKQTLGGVMRSTLSGDDNLQQLDLANAASIEKSQDAVRGCDLYSVHITDASGDRQVNICAANGLPRFVDVAKGTQKSSLEYSNYNAVFTIARPI